MLLQYLCGGEMCLVVGTTTLHHTNLHTNTTLHHTTTTTSPPQTIYFSIGTMWNSHYHERLTTEGLAAGALAILTGAKGRKPRFPQDW